MIFGIKKSVTFGFMELKCKIGLSWPLNRAVIKILTIALKSLIETDFSFSVYSLVHRSRDISKGEDHHGAEGQNPLPRPADHVAGDAAQGMVGLQGCECTLLGHIELICIVTEIMTFRNAAFLSVCTLYMIWHCSILRRSRSLLWGTAMQGFLPPNPSGYRCSCCACEPCVLCKQ